MKTVPKDDSETTNAFLTLSLVLSKDRTLNTDGKTTFNIMKDRITVVNEKIDYFKNGHRLYWLNTICWRHQEQYHWHLPWCTKDRFAIIFWRTGIQIQS